MTWEKLLANYWAQILVLIGATGALLKIIFDYKFKKKEITFSLFASQRIETISKFLADYYSLISIFSIEIGALPSQYRREKNPEFNKSIAEGLTELIKKYGALHLYYDKKDIKLISEAILQLQDAHSMYIELYTHFLTGIIDNVEFTNKCNQIITKLDYNTLLLSDILKNLRKSYI